MEELKLKEVMECMHKSYIYKSRFIPIRFYKTPNRYSLSQENEYICNEVMLDREGLKFSIAPFSRVLERIKSSQKYTDNYELGQIVNAYNVLQIIDNNIFKDFYTMEVEKGTYDNKERRKILKEKYYDLPVLYTLDDIYDGDYKPVTATKNAYHEREEKMRFYFCIDDCEHCQYWNNECNNIMSDRYGMTDIINGCHDCKEII